MFCIFARLELDPDFWDDSQMVQGMKDVDALEGGHKMRAS
jgi:hypothetical protein